MGKTRQPKGHAPSAQTRTKKQKRKDIEKAIKLQDRKYTYFMGTKKKATVVSQKILKKAIIQSKQLFQLRQRNKSKRHRIYKTLFKIYAQKGKVKKGQTLYWDVKTYQIINKLYPDDESDEESDD
eukprot:265366_1